MYDFDGELFGKEGQIIRWVALNELNKYSFPEANKSILSAIKLGRDYAIVGGDNVQQVLRDEGSDLAAKRAALAAMRELAEDCLAKDLMLTIHCSVRMACP